MLPAAPLGALADAPPPLPWSDSVSFDVSIGVPFGA